MPSNQVEEDADPEMRNGGREKVEDRQRIERTTEEQQSLTHAADRGSLGQGTVETGTRHQLTLRHRHPSGQVETDTHTQS